MIAAFRVSAFGCALLFAGCDAIPSRVQDRFSAIPPKTQFVGGAQRDVFYAAQGALKNMDFQLSRTAEAQGIVNGFSRIRSGEGPRESRQYSIEIRLHSVGPAETEVAVLLREQIEGGVSSGIGATDQPLRQHGLYDAFFAMLKKTLAEKSALPPDVKKR